MVHNTEFVERNWVEGAKEIVIGALVIDNTQKFWMDAHSPGGMLYSINPTYTDLMMGVEIMFAVIAVTLVVFGVCLLVRGMKTAITVW